MSAMLISIICQKRNLYDNTKYIYSYDLMYDLITRKRENWKQNLTIYIMLYVCMFGPRSLFTFQLYQTCLVYDAGLKDDVIIKLISD